MDEKEFPELCECDRDHEKDAETLRQQMPNEDRLFDLADFFKLFGDSTRVKILWALSQSSAWETLPIFWACPSRPSPTS